MSANKGPLHIDIIL